MLKPRLLLLTAAGAVAASLAAAPIAGAATTYYLQLDGVRGEQAITTTTTTSAGPQTYTNSGLMGLDSYQWGAQRVDMGSPSTAPGAGKADLGDLTIAKDVDSTSPTLFQYLGEGKLLPGAELVAVRRRDVTQQPQIYQRYCFEQVGVKDINDSGSSGDANAKETVTFEFGAVQDQFTKSNADGTLSSNVVSAGWNQISNTASMTFPANSAIGSSYCSNAPHVR